jgi:dTDP-L-rhamnose 4-epimerase
MQKDNLSMKNKCVLVTGGAGFIGSNLSVALVSKGYRVKVLDNLSPQIHSESPQLYNRIQGRVDFCHGSVLSHRDWSEALRDVDVVVHYAAETGTGQSMYEVEKYTKVNIQGSSIFLDILASGEHRVKKMILASSRAVYGEGKHSCVLCGPVYPKERKEADMSKGDFLVKCPNCGANTTLLATDEDSPAQPTSIYGVTKYVQEQMFMMMGRSLNIPAVALRYQNVYGPGQSLSNPYTGILSIFSTRILNENQINIFEDGKESRDFVHIDDVVKATILSIEKKEANDQVFNVGSGVAVDVVDVARALAKAYARKSDIRVSGNYRLGDIRHNYADVSKIKSFLGFNSEVKFADGVQSFTDWVKSQAIVADLFEMSIREMKEKGFCKE